MKKIFVTITYVLTLLTVVLLFCSCENGENITPTEAPISAPTESPTQKHDEAPTETPTQSIAGDPTEEVTEAVTEGKNETMDPVLDVVDLSTFVSLPAGLYDATEGVLIYSWDELVTRNILYTDGSITPGNEDKLDGVLVISSELGANKTPIYSSCTKLDGVVIPNGFKEIAPFAFSKCAGLASVSIGENIDTIGSYAFSECTNLNQVDGTDNIQVIMSKAFSQCSNLKSLDLTNNEVLTGISDYAFAWCDSLLEIYIPASVTEIGENCFQNCGNLKTVTIEEDSNLRIISAFAFAYCNDLANLYIPQYIEKVEGNALVGCTSITDITVDENNTKYISYAGNLYEVIKDTNDNISGYRLLKYSSGKMDVAFDDFFDGTIEIAANAFAGSVNLTSVTLTPGIEIINNYAFSNCTRLVEFTFVETIKQINQSVFDGCSSLKRVKFEVGDSLTVDNFSFAGCTNLDEIHVDSIEEWCSIQFVGISANPLYYAHNLYVDGKLVTELVIPYGVSEIYDYAFAGCSTTKVVIDEGVRIVGKRVFENCSALTTVVISDDVKSIEDYAFSDCINLTSVVMSDSITSIGNSVFNDCSNLTSITYEGTLNKWNSIDKNEFWADSPADYKIICIDGTIAKDGTVAKNN